MAITKDDWADRLPPNGLGDDWTIIPSTYTSYQLIDYSEYLIVGFRKMVQRISRLIGQTGNIGISSNDFGITEMRHNYQLEFWYRSYSLPLIVSRNSGEFLIQVGEYYPSSTTVVHVTETLVADMQPFNGLTFLMPSSRETGNNFWFEIDRVSCREIL